MTTPRADDGIFVNVIDMIDMCTRAKDIAALSGNKRLANAADSILSALTRHLGKRTAKLPSALREHYTYLTEHLYG